jgi:hypothetical protein
MFLVLFGTSAKHEGVSSIGLYEYIQYIYNELVQFQNLSHIFTIVFLLNPLSSLEKHKKQDMTIYLHY